jgi:predicted nucleic acid-binding protein
LQFLAKRSPLSIELTSIFCNAEIPFLNALDRYRKTKVHFVDCMIAATAAAENVPVALFDQEFRKFTDVRIET